MADDKKKDEQKAKKDEQKTKPALPIYEHQRVASSKLADLMSAAASPSVVPSPVSANDYLEAAKQALTRKVASQTWDEFSKSLATRETLSREIAEMRQRVSEATSALHEARAKGSKSNEKIASLEAMVAQLRLKEDLGFLLTRVNAPAQEKLGSDEELRSVFAENRECNAFVMSVDIRRSTELMLKARAPSMFADFISALTKELHACVVDNNGVFDKFTGDGILAFFPEGFSGDDFGYSVVKAADECHRAFDRIYRSSRSSFSSVLKGIGLGIGIDFGTVRLLRVAEGLTVVGIPVVYACRLSGSEPGQTLLNQPAFEVIASRHGQNLIMEETSLNIKHEGEVLAYAVKLGYGNYVPAEPAWMKS